MFRQGKKKNLSFPCLGVPGTVFYWRSMNWGLAEREVRPWRINLIFTVVRITETLEWERILVIRWTDRGKAKAHSFPRGRNLVPSMSVGGLCSRGGWGWFWAPKCKPVCLAVESPKKGPLKPCFSNINV